MKKTKHNKKRILAGILAFVLAGSMIVGMALYLILAALGQM